MDSPIVLFEPTCWRCVSSAFQWGLQTVARWSKIWQLWTLIPWNAIIPSCAFCRLSGKKYSFLKVITTHCQNWRWILASVQALPPLSSLGTFVYLRFHLFKGMRLQTWKDGGAGADLGSLPAVQMCSTNKCWRKLDKRAKIAPKFCSSHRLWSKHHIIGSYQ